MATAVIPKGVFVHENGICESESVGDGTRVWAFAHVLPKARIGRDCNICDHVFVENDVVVGDRVTLKSGVQLWDGARLGDDVFVGPNATFTNDLHPRSKNYKAPAITTIERGASIGANATILPGITVGAYAMIGAGAVVIGSVPPRAVVVGSPGRVVKFAGTQPAIETLAGATDPRLVELGGATDERGGLGVIEHGPLPFVPQRTFFVSGVPVGSVRGIHAHRTCHQLIVAVQGSVTVLWDDGKDSVGVTLDAATHGLHLPPGIWSSQCAWSDGAVLLVLASHPYDKADYVTDYAEFLSLGVK